MRAVALGKMSWPRTASPWEEGEFATGGRKSNTDDRLEGLPELLETLHRRQAEGKQTSLQQLHGITTVDQPRALRLLRHLKENGLAEIEPDLHDELASQVTLTRATFRRLSRLLQ